MPDGLPSQANTLLALGAGGWSSAERAPPGSRWCSWACAVVKGEVDGRPGGVPGSGSSSPPRTGSASVCGWAPRPPPEPRRRSRGRSAGSCAALRAHRGEVATIGGGRALAIDTRRGWLPSGSLTTGRLAAVDLETGARVATHYLGPWLRSVRVDEARGLAFVSSADALDRVGYKAQSPVR